MIGGTEKIKKFLALSYLILHKKEKRKYLKLIKKKLNYTNIVNDMII